MHIWVDADACPGVIGIFSTAPPSGCNCRWCWWPTSFCAPRRRRGYARCPVPKGFDVADNHIAAQVQAGDSGDSPTSRWRRQ